jgi:hypothetical protein
LPLLFFCHSRRESAVAVALALAVAVVVAVAFLFVIPEGNLLLLLLLLLLLPLSLPLPLLFFLSSLKRVPGELARWGARGSASRSQQTRPPLTTNH